MGEALRQRRDLGVVQRAPRHEGRHSHAGGESVRRRRRRRRPRRFRVEQRGLKYRQVGQRKEDVGVREDHVDRQRRRILGAQQAQRDHADAAAAIVAEHAEFRQVPHLGDRVDQQAGVVVQRIDVRLRWLVGQSVAGKVEQVDVEVRVQFTRQREVVDARRRKAVNEHQCRRPGRAAAPAEHRELAPVVGRRRRPPPKLRAATLPLREMSKMPASQRKQQLAGQSAVPQISRQAEQPNDQQHSQESVAGVESASDRDVYEKPECKKQHHESRDDDEQAHRHRRFRARGFVPGRFGGE